MVDPLFNHFPDMSQVRRGNVMARARMIILYDQSEEFHGLVVGTGNKTEILLGYTTLFGDSACALNPLGDLYKTQIRQLAREMGVPRAILAKPPSADLWLGQTDEGELGFTYADVDRLLYLLVDQRYSPEECAAAGFDEALSEKSWIESAGTHFKRVMPPIAKLTNRTIGYDFLYLRDWGTWNLHVLTTFAYHLHSLRHRRFRLLWFGLMISIAGTQMQIWSVFWHIRTLTDQPIALGGLGLARIIPVIVFSLIGGAVADVANRRNILFITQSAMALIALGIGFSDCLSGKIALWQIYALMASQAVAVAFDTPSRQSLVPNLVPARDLPNAFSMSSLAFQIGSIVGPALSGLVIAYLGQSYTYLFNAVSYLAVIAALILMGRVEQQVQRSGRPVVNLTAIPGGDPVHIGQSQIILATMILDFFATFFSSANTLMPIFARDILKVGAVEYGWLSAAQSVGAVGAALILSQMDVIRHQGKVFLSAVVVFGLATIGFGISTMLWAAFLALVLVGASDSVSTIIRNTIRQLQTPDYIRGRMTSINQIFFMGGPQLGEVEAGLVAQLFGAQFAVVTGGIGCILAVFWVRRRWPQLLSV